MGENYAGSQYIAYTTKIRAVLKELPSFAGDFFRGIENDTLVRTKLFFIHIYYTPNCSLNTSLTNS